MKTVWNRENCMKKTCMKKAVWNKYVFQVFDREQEIGMISREHMKKYTNILDWWDILVILLQEILWTNLG